MTGFEKTPVALYVDRSGGRWVVRDPDGRFWVVPPGDDPWNNRQPFEPTQISELEPLPAHYKYMLGISF